MTAAAAIAAIPVDHFCFLVMMIASYSSDMPQSTDLDAIRDRVLTAARSLMQTGLFALSAAAGHNAASPGVLVLYGR